MAPYDYQTIHGVVKYATIRPLLPAPPPTQPHPPSSYSAETFHFISEDLKHFGEQYHKSLFGDASVEDIAERNPDDELQVLKEQLELAKYENHLRCNIMSSMEKDKINLQVEMSEMWGELEDKKEKLHRMIGKGPEDSEKCICCDGTGWRELRPWKVSLDEVDIVYKDTLRGLLLHIAYTKKMCRDIKGWLASRVKILDCLRLTKRKEMVSIIQRVNLKLQGVERKVGRIDAWCVGQGDIIEKLRAQVEARLKGSLEEDGGGSGEDEAEL